MKRNIWKSFQVEIIFCCFLSILLTALTLGAVAGAGYLVHIMSRNAVVEEGEKFKEPVKEEAAPDQNRYQKKQYGMVQRGPKPVYIVGMVLFVTLAIALFIFYFLLLTKKYARHLKKISQCIYEVTEGAYETRIDIPGDDEFANIAAGLNKMIEKIDYVIKSERQNEMAKNSLITNVAHDLRTPLTSIIGYLQLAAGEGHASPEERKKYIEIAYQKSRRLEGMLEDLFSYTKYSFSDVALKLSSMDMVQFINQMIEEFYPSMEEAGLTVDFHHQESSIMIEADGEKMARAIANLFSNAVKYGRNGKVIRIHLSISQKIHFYMINYGEIIPPEDLQHIFDRFYRVETSRSLDTGGTGLGLAITKRIVEMHHGSIEVSSGDEGTVFHIVLPVSQEEV
ncbi:MAG: HAMP domain-containing sensor histidine kinase [Clostridiales bacterium]|nr:HAMP domain-containing sensor histidine kinase [Clostridiales bacterium]